MSTDAPCTQRTHTHSDLNVKRKSWVWKKNPIARHLSMSLLWFYFMLHVQIHRRLVYIVCWMQRHNEILWADIPITLLLLYLMFFFCVVFERLGLVRLHSILTFSHCSSWTGCGERGCAKVYVQRDHTIQSQATYNCAMALNITYQALCAETNSGAPWNCIECALRSCTLYQPTSWDAVQRVYAHNQRLLQQSHAEIFITMSVVRCSSVEEVPQSVVVAVCILEKTIFSMMVGFSS